MLQSQSNLVGSPDPLAEVRRLSDQVEQLEAEMERSQRLATLGLLAGSIAHEFNNILTPVLSYAQMALAAPEDAELARKALRKAIEGTEKAAQIATSMLGFVRDDTAEHAVIRGVVDDALRCLGRDLSREGIALSIDVPRNLAVKIRPNALEQVLINLILNAVEAMRPGGGRLVIRSHSGATWNNSPHTSIVIEDSGCGIPGDMLSRIFDPFVTKSADGGRRGTGLGLTICKRLIEEAGGAVTARSTAGAGSTFEILLPSAAI